MTCRQGLIDQKGKNDTQIEQSEKHEQNAQNVNKGENEKNWYTYGTSWPKLEKWTRQLKIERMKKN